MKKTLASVTATSLVVTSGILGIRTYRHYRRDMRLAGERIQAGGSQVVETRRGLIEYATTGNGLPVLISHGVVGGFDHGLGIIPVYLGDSFRALCVSRFGYLRSPLPADASPAAQADLYASLLDELGLKRVAIMGFSAGGPSALQFALRHPDRTAVLVLWSMAVPPYDVPSGFMATMMEAVFRSDPLWWMVVTFLPNIMMRIAGVPKERLAHLTPQDQTFLARLLPSFLPMSRRSEGALNDVRVTNPDLNYGYPLERIAVPTLVIHAVDDPMPPFLTAEVMAGRIPGTRFIRIDNGGHLLLGHHEQVRAEISDFITQHMRKPAGASRG
jgi:pimeloyl-ACP methyl ester carboxylesterase